MSTLEGNLTTRLCKRRLKLEMRALAKLLLEHLKNINSMDKWVDRTPLHIAAEKGMKPIVQMLLERGANIEVQDIDGETALYRAARWGHAPVVSLLLNYGAYILAQNNGGGMPMSRAAQNRHMGVVRILLDSGPT
jgi:ankyrin repeat protein